MLQISDILKNVSDGAKRGLADLSSNERSSTRFAANPAPVVVWNLTNACNMTCPHCYSSAKQKSSPDELTLAQAFELIDRLASGGIKIVILSGGEPLLRGDFFEIADYIKTKGMMCHLSTNGTLIDADLAKRLVDSGIKYVGVSLDGLPEFNDTYRGLKDGFSLAWKGLLHARDAGLATGVRMTVTRPNKGHWKDILNDSIRDRIPRFYISHLVYGGRAVSYSGKDLDAVECRELMTELFDRALDMVERDISTMIVSGGNDADGVYLYHYIRDHFGEDAAASIWKLLKKRGGNSAGEKIINIDHKGDVHPDQFWRTVTMGNILRDDLAAILDGELARKLKNRSSLLKGKCSRCGHREICRGSHRERAYAVCGDIWESDPSCYLNEKELFVA